MWTSRPQACGAASKLNPGVSGWGADWQWEALSFEKGPISPRFGDFESTPVPARDTHSEPEKERDSQDFRLFFFLDLAIAELKNTEQI